MSNTFKSDILEDKVALISGGTSGINLGIAKAYAAQGARVVVFGRNLEKAQAAQAEIRASGDKTALGLSCDVRDYDGVQSVVEITAKEFGSLDKNVVWTGMGEKAELWDEKKWDKYISETNKDPESIAESLDGLI